LEKHKVDDAVTVDKKHRNDIQGSEEEDRLYLHRVKATHII